MRFGSLRPGSGGKWAPEPDIHQLKDLRVPGDFIPGDQLDVQIADAIQEHKRLVVVLSPESMKGGGWVPL